MQYDFADRIVFVSGAGRGLGRRAAERLGALGARLVVTDHDRGAVDNVIAALRSADVAVCGLAGDIADEKTSRQIAALIDERYGGLDYAINNAGIGQARIRLHELDSAEAQRVIAVNLLGVFFAMKHQIPLMLRQIETDGRQRAILNVASAAGLTGSPMLAVYAAAKHGVVGLTRSAAHEYGRKGIRVNCICPAFTRTELVNNALDTSPHGRDKAETNMVAYNPMQRLGEIDEVVQAMIWAISSGNSFFNGHALAIDGGLCA
jgi:NAD(P)-dependent dehydrogenase (short-subunit alcohol dehydrogenase family)